MGARVDAIRALSPRQAEAVSYTWHGYTLPEIARAMGCAENTAHRHLQTAYLRLGVTGEGPSRARVLAAVALYRAVALAMGD